MRFEVSARAKSLNFAVAEIHHSQVLTLKAVHCIQSRVILILFSMPPKAIIREEGKTIVRASHTFDSQLRP